MKWSSRTISILEAVAGASLLAATLMPVGDVIRGMIAVPGVVALLGVLVQILRDSVGFERAQHLQLDEQIFALGASSAT